MTIKLNKTELTLSDSEINLLPLLKANNLNHDHGIAIAVNDEILPKQSWEGYPLKDNDNILIITATQGG